MVIVLTIIHVLVCFFLVVVVLLQSGKAADLAGAFGGMGSQTAFGPRGSATVLSKATTLAAACFMVTSLTLAIMATRSAGGSGSVLEKQKAPGKAPAAAPAPGAAPGQSSVPIPIPPGTPAPAGGATPATGGATPPPGATTVIPPSEPGKTPSMTVIRPDGTKTTVPIPAGVQAIPQQQPAPAKK
ncbi:MAG TPA: preprotein translocase subunit SecG [Bryobacteraceae bacterium]|nr:preprotein translocase subunit SecG [Bryobacteraceae bacterium]